jgi:SGNH hydrolase-like domain, acetyltransferase AlgX
VPWSGLALAAASTVFGLLLIELGARAYVRERGAADRALARESPISRYHPLLGWDKPPGAQQWIRRPEFEVLLKFNSHGLRGPEVDYEKPRGMRRVLVLGDSFAEGYYVNDEDSLRAVLEDLLRREGCGPAQVLNAGTIAYSTDQEYLYFKDELYRYQPDVVALLFYYNDLVYNASATGPGGEAKPYFVLEDGALVLRNSPVPPPTSGQLSQPDVAAGRLRPWRGSIALRLLSNRTMDSSPRLHRGLARLGLVEPVSADPSRELWPFGPGHKREVDEMWARTQAILGALAAEVRQRGARLVLLYVPVRFEVNDDIWELTRRRYAMGPRWDRHVVFDRLKSIAEALGVPVVDPRAVLRRAEESGQPAYWTRDFHWTAVGNAVSAHELLPVVASELACGSSRNVSTAMPGSGASAAPPR